MTVSLPTYPAHAGSVVGVVPHLVAALAGADDVFRPVTSAIVCVVDGLGALNLAARRGHARFLAGLQGPRDVARTVFPSTTAAGLTSILTGVPPGIHGLVGYRVRIPGTDLAPDQLHGWERAGLDPHSWQRAAPLLERESLSGRPCFVVSKPEYTGTGFTAATLRGADIRGVSDPVARVELAVELAAATPGSLTYLYLPELDGTGHRHGWESDEWIAALETVDGALRGLDAPRARGVGAVVTADHGMVDVPPHRQILFGDALVDGVRVVGGEPRMLHLYVEPGEEGSVLRAWRAAEESRSWVLSRAEAVDLGVFGPVEPEVLPRIGDVIVAARAGVAYYDDREPDHTPRRMIGQHGSLTAQETMVPLVRVGALA